MPVANAPYSGGFAPGAHLFAVDGDFTQCDPCGLPEISFPFKGDSILSTRDVIYLANIGGSGPPGITWQYQSYPLGTFPNVQPWSPNQAAMILEQEFMVAQANYQPMRLNTAYNPAWAIGWTGTFPDAQPIPQLNQLYLVIEGELRDMGGGICKIKRTWASVPKTRNELEQFSYAFPGFGGDAATNQRQRVPFSVQSRVQYDYYIFDDWGVLSGVLLEFPNGPLLDATTGLSPAGLILNAQYYFFDQTAVAQNNFTDSLTGTGTSPDDTVPPLSAYQSLYPDGSAFTSNGLAAELIAETSTMTRWMGNIFEKRTRYVIAQ